MNERITSMENYLAFFRDIYQQNQINAINCNSVYYYLIRDRETYQEIKPYHSKWIKKFRNIPNIKVFVDENWSYFCQFVNSDIRNNINNEHNELKVYISVDEHHIDKAATDIFKFLAAHNIKHISKIGSDERRDAIVIRLENENDLPLLQNFVHNNKNIKKGLIKSNPFLITDGIMGYAMDGELSFNSVISKYISNYLYQKKINNQLNSVCLQDFFLYCSNIYNSTFVNGNDNALIEFCQNFDTYLDPKLLNNYREVSKLILTSMQTNDLRYLMEHVKEVKNPYHKQNEINKIENTLHNKQHQTKTPSSNINQDVELCLDTMFKRFEYTQAITNIKEYIQTSNPTYLTSQNNVRKIISKNYSIQEFSNIFYQKIKEPKYHHSNFIPNPNLACNLNMDITNIIENCTIDTVIATLPKQKDSRFTLNKQECLQTGLTEIITNQDYSNFSRFNNTRNSMHSLGSNVLIAELIKGAYIKTGVTLIENGHANTNLNNFPTTPLEAANFITSTLEKQGANATFQIVSQYPDIQKLLIKNYANLLTTTDKVKRTQAANSLAPYFQNRLIELDNLEQSLLSEHQRNIQQNSNNQK